MAFEVQRSEPCGISVLISGGGVGGLMTALECWRRGCDVRVFERTSTNSKLGDSFTIGPSAIRAFKYWPELQKRNDEVAYDPLVAIHDQTGKRLRGPVEFGSLIANAGTDGKPLVRFWRHTRPKFHGILLEQLTKIGVAVEYNKEVVDYFEDIPSAKAGVVLKDGSRESADLVVAADGVRGKSWALVAGEPVPARSSGSAIFRVAFPVEHAMKDPVLAERFKLEDGRSVIEMWKGPGMYAGFWRNEDVMSWGLNHPDQDSAQESWSHNASPEEALKFTATIPGWPEYADRLIRLTPQEYIVDWKIMWRDPQPKWTSPGGLVVQLGDAAHTLLPSSGNGGTQALEDAISLAACITMAGKGNISKATQVHNLLRFQRVSCLQAMGIGNREARDTTKTNVREGGGKRSDPVFGRWLVDHDPEDYVLENYEKALSHITDGTPFKNTNLPAGVDYKPWTIDSLVEALDKGEPTILDGDWS